MSTLDIRACIGIAILKPFRWQIVGPKVSSAITLASEIPFYESLDQYCELRSVQSMSVSKCLLLLFRSLSLLWFPSPRYSFGSIASERCVPKQQLGSFTAIEPASQTERDRRRGGRKLEQDDIELCSSVRPSGGRSGYNCCIYVVRKAHAPPCLVCVCVHMAIFLIASPA